MGIMPDCREVHRLTSEGLDRRLSLLERARMSMHLRVCEACRRFGAQMDLIRRAMRQGRLPDATEAERETP
jgi:predicted anti-sigma-YlaC factor YlaD